MNTKSSISLLFTICDNGSAGALTEALAGKLNTEKVLELVPELSLTIGCAQNHPAHRMDVYNHTISVIKGLPNDKILRLTALMHDLGKVSTKVVGEDGFDHFWGHEAVSADIADRIMKRLGYSSVLTEFVKLLVKYHDYKIDVAELPKAISFFGRLLIEDIYSLNEVSGIHGLINEKDAGVFVLNYLFTHQLSDLNAHSFAYAKRKRPMLCDLFKCLENENDLQIHQRYINNCT